MVQDGLEPMLTTKISRLAKKDQGVFELMELWYEAKSDPKERKELVKELRKIVEENDEWIAKHL